MAVRFAVDGNRNRHHHVPVGRGHADAVAGYAILPACCVGLFALILPMLELVAGAALIVTKWSREAALILLALLLSFFVGLSQAWIRGLEISRLMTIRPVHTKGVFTDEYGNSCDFIAFNKHLDMGMRWDVIAQPQINEYYGERKRQLQVIDFRPSAD